MRKLIAVLTALCMLFAALPVFAVEITDMAQVTFRIDNAVVADGRLAPGQVTASVQVVGSGKYLVSLGRYDGGKLADFSAESLQTVPMGQLELGSATLTLDVPNELEDGDSVRVIVMDSQTLEPMTVNNSTLVYKAPVTDADTGYDGIYERYYTLDGADGSLTVVQEGARKYLRVSEIGTPFRLKDMGGGWVGFADEKYRLYDNEGTPGRRIYGFGSTAMLWKLIPDGKQYYIQNYDGGYLAFEDGEAVLREEPYPFTLTKTGESPFTLVTAVEGYKLLTETQKQRLIEICTSPGAVVFPNGSNSNSLLDNMEAAFTRIYDNRDATTPEAQKSAILAAMETVPYYNAAGTDEINGVTITGLPGGDAEISQSGPDRETLDIWDIGIKEYNRLDVTYTGSGHSQTVKFYYDETGGNNVQTAIQALARFPYEYRRFIQQVNVYVPASSFTYNCDGPVLTVRVTDGTNVETMARNFAHELGHSINMCQGEDNTDLYTYWCHSDEWRKAVNDDIIIVSDYANQYHREKDHPLYGQRNYDENIAEFARLYFQSYGNRDRMMGVKQLYPNCYASFNNLLKKIGMEPLY